MSNRGICTEGMELTFLLFFKRINIFLPASQRYFNSFFNQHSNSLFFSTHQSEYFLSHVILATTTSPHLCPPPPKLCLFTHAHILSLFPTSAGPGHTSVGRVGQYKDLVGCVMVPLVVDRGASGGLSIPPGSKPPLRG